MGAGKIQKAIKFMQIIIPMSGFGERFRKAGYAIPKPLIEIDGKPIVQHVVEMFPGEADVMFICNREHLNDSEFNMYEILKKISPTSNIIGIDPHKLGPVHTVLKAIDHINLDTPVIVNYADFTCDWNYLDFCGFIESSNCDGIIPSYRGFHPHTIWSNYYAYLRVDGSQVIDIQEKEPFTDSPRNEFASSGTYYFKSGELLRCYCEQCVHDDLTVMGEYYVSMVYKPMIEDGLNIQVYELDHFMQWGVPNDLEEYRYWSNLFRALDYKTDRPKHDGALILPMVGLGSRFQSAGEKVPKPLISVSGKPMASQALMDLPVASRQRFILRSDMQGIDYLKIALGELCHFPEFTILDHMTDGQATTCVEGAVGLDLDAPLTIAACDNGMIYDVDKFHILMNRDDVDVIVWGARGYPGAARSPEMYSWIDADVNDVIHEVSVKQQLEDPVNDLIVVGTFTFKKLRDFLSGVVLMKSRQAKVNGEYYVDAVINDLLASGLRCVVFEIDYYICWGTPNDLHTFEYWQACFDGWEGHPYRIVASD